MKTLPFVLVVRVTLLVAVAGLTGCGNHEAEIRLAREAADRSAEQSRQLESVVQAETSTHRELVGLQRDVQHQGVEIDKQRDAVEQERKQIAARRLTETTLTPIIEWGGVVLVISLALAYCACLVYGLRHDDGTEAMNDLLLQELTRDASPSLAAHVRVLAVKQDQLLKPTVPAIRKSANP